MTDAQRFRALLEEERDRLRAIRGGADGHLSDSQEASTGELTTFDQHPGDVASETLEREQDESIREHAEAQLEEVEAALRRLDDGSYGRCAVCGADIGEARLQVRPQTRYCVEHQHERERTRGAERQPRA
ncbi:MAG TPA: TraR/DksA C4-type zinc finger protein [Egibacteraceae bacterium]|nr:TraR/DksA C4-type zinc finger protein [Egibacteraceae bacterium]